MLPPGSFAVNERVSFHWIAWNSYDAHRRQKQVKV